MALPELLVRQVILAIMALPETQEIMAVAARVVMVALAAAAGERELDHI